MAAAAAQARPVLIGTDSIADSEALVARVSRPCGIAHAVLNARQDSAEAAIVARAGEAGAVTVATNMAGRGTDIALDAGVAASAAGCTCICCQHNGSRRLDRQLAGRCARQGDPGSVETWLALDGGLFADHAGRSRHRPTAEPVGRLPAAAHVPRDRRRFHSSCTSGATLRSAASSCARIREWERYMRFCAADRMTCKEM